MEETPQDMTGKEIVPAASAPQGRGPRLTHGLLWLAIGSVVDVLMPFAGVILLGYAFRELVQVPRGLLAGIPAAVVLCAASLVLGLDMATMLVLGVLSALGVVWCMRNAHATVLGVSLVVVAVTLVGIGIDAIALVLSGKDLHQFVSSMYSMIDEAMRATMGTGIEADMTIAQVTPIIRAVWPLMYVGSAAIDALAAGIGSYMMFLRQHPGVRPPAFANFDAPIWSVGVLAVSVLGFGISFASVPFSDVIRTVCATLLMSVRFIFTFQGMGVVGYLLQRNQMGCFLQTAVIFLSIWLETMFFVLSIVGLIDVWANFRHLPRGDSSDARATQ